jgi:hypothetical protein
LPVARLEPNSKSMMKTKLTLFVAVLAVALFGTGCASTGTSGDPLKNGLIAYYPFNGNSLDESGNGIHGGVNGATFDSDRHNKRKSAYSFNGRSWVELPRSKKLQFGAGDFSYYAWIKTSLDNIKSSVTSTVISEDSNSGPLRMLVFASNGTIIFGARDDANINVRLESMGSLADSKWHQIVGIRNGARFSLAVDGNIIAAEENEQAGSSDVKITVGIGARMDSASKNAFKGSIDDVRIYNRALSADEVKALYDLEKPKGK